MKDKGRMKNFSRLKETNEMWKLNETYTFGLDTRFFFSARKDIIERTRVIYGDLWIRQQYCINANFSALDAYTVII